ncbi:MAG: hypothetical protein V7736_08360 [Colwellia polaris]|jgi:hypothetical protein|uniref:hypothetical protein n=1 Tax=Colwellia polaris TaxID=326537 RepID=UPI000A1734E6|nr:hypothetical protein [Colwellia polaris]
MSWGLFHFKCRYFIQKTNEELTLQQANKAFEGADLHLMYSEKDLTGIQKELFDKIFQLSSITEIKRALNVFSSINLAESLTSSKTLKVISNKLSYLEVITAVFIMFITIYKLYVYPVFSDIIQQYPALGNSSFDFVSSMWLLGLAVAFLTFMFTFSYRKYIKNIDVLIINKPSRAMKFFTSKNVMAEILMLNKIITTPLDINRGDESFRKKMIAIVEAGLDESVELTSLFGYHSERLELAIWQHFKRMFGVIYTLVILGIAFNIMQIYEPLFKLGEIV